MELECWMRDVITETESFETLPSFTCNKNDHVSDLIKNFFDHLSLVKIL